MLVKVISRHFDVPDMQTLAVAKEHGAYEKLTDAFAQAPEAIHDAICDSGLRGKGGGGAKTAGKWELMHRHDGPRYVIVNADESEPGTFKDRQIIGKDPHLLIEGIILTCYAVGARDAYVYIRGEYRQFADILQNAIDEAYADSWLGSDTRYGYRVDLTLHRGAGAYICGEKSALVESLEGNRGHPRLKPHTHLPEFYFGRPALVNNVETIASVPFIAYSGAEAYRAYGTAESPGTLLFGLSGHVENPGIYEAPFGTPMLEFIEQIGGGVKHGRKLKAVIPGGASTPVLTAEEVAKATLDYESLKALGSSLGTGGMIIMDETVDMVKALQNLLRFYHHESCGQCTPCREGTGWSERLLDRFVAHEATEEDLETLRSVSGTMNGKTICVFAPAASSVIDGFLTRFEEEFRACIKKA
jgi:NADH-quinone oxidoreductase subunit F